MKHRSNATTVVLTMIFLLVLAGVASAFAPGDIGMVSGERWQAMGQEERETYVAGVADGINIGMLTLAFAFSEEFGDLLEPEDMFQEEDLIHTDELPFFLAAVNEFYSGEENQDVTVFEFILGEIIASF